MLGRSAIIALLLALGLNGIAVAQHPTQMRYYLMEFKFAGPAIKAMVQTPNDRTGPVRKLVEGFGGKLDSLYFILPGGQFDGIYIAEFPDEASARASAMAGLALGNVVTNQVIPLLTARDLQMVMEKAHVTPQSVQTALPLVPKPAKAQ